MVTIRELNNSTILVIKMDTSLLVDLKALLTYGVLRAVLVLFKVQ